LLGVVPVSGAEPGPLDPEACGELPSGGVEPEVLVSPPLGLEPDDVELGPVGPVAPAGGEPVVLPLVELLLGALPCCGWLAAVCCGCGCGCGCGGSIVVPETCCVVGLTTGGCAPGSGFAVTGRGAAGSVVTATALGLGFACFGFAA
jgi:hypothetical protein